MDFQEQSFPTSPRAITELLEGLNINQYGGTRNYLDGQVSRLSPYIARGVLSLTQVAERAVINSKYRPEKFIQELAWREYWQRIWKLEGDITHDIKQEQADVLNRRMPLSVYEGQTGINALDHGIQELQETGYIHNHMRMYLASVVCNIGKSHWRTPAHWMYYHLLDADWGSNALSWQWVAGSNSNKKYFANQENINHFTKTQQSGTFLDRSYEELAELPQPQELSEWHYPRLNTPFPDVAPILINPELPTAIYTIYNLDPHWRQNNHANRILLLEPKHFFDFPIAQHTMDFVLGLGSNIPGLQVAIMEFDELQALHHDKQEIFFKEHPFSSHFQGTEDPREWLFDLPLDVHPKSFFNFWKKAKKQFFPQED